MRDPHPMYIWAAIIGLGGFPRTTNKYNIRLGGGRVGEDTGEVGGGKLGMDMIVFYYIHVLIFKNERKTTKENKIVLS